MNLIDEFPNLSFTQSTNTLLSLIDAEHECSTELFPYFHEYIAVWEYGFYFLSLFVKHSSINRNQLILAAFFTESVDALRASFLLNISGYHSNSISILRRTHESYIRAISLRCYPDELEAIVTSSSINKFSSRIKLRLSKLFNIESCYTHSNKIKSIRAWKDIFNKDVSKAGVSYGPQADTKEFGFSAKVSIFWLYALIKSAPYIFTNEISDYWLSKQTESLLFLYKYLKKTKSSLYKDCDEVTKVINDLSDETK